MDIAVTPSDLQLMLVTMIAVQWWALSQYSSRQRFFSYWALGWTWLAILIGLSRIYGHQLSGSETNLPLIQFGLVLAGLMQLYYFIAGAWLFSPEHGATRRQLRAGLVVVVAVAAIVGFPAWLPSDEVAGNMAIRNGLRNLGLALVFLYVGSLLYRQRKPGIFGATLVTSGCLIGLGIHMAVYAAGDINSVYEWATGSSFLPYDSTIMVSGEHFLIDLVLDAGVGIGTLLLLAGEGQRSNHALRRREAEFRGTFNEAPTGIALLDHQGVIRKANRALSDLLELPESQLLGESLLRFIAKGSIDLDIASAGRGAKIHPRRYKVMLRTASGRSIPGFAHLSFLQETSYRHPRVVAQLLDMTEHHNLQERLSHLAMHDSITGLPNRAYFEDHLHATIKRMQRRKISMTVMFLDLNHFKSVNDSLGHEAGDRLLQAVARRLRASVREGDFVARYGGDEFMIVLEECGKEEEARVVADRIVTAVGQPVRLEGTEVAPSISVGVVISAPTDEPNRLVRESDMAMYQAKAEKSGRIHLVDRSASASLALAL